MKSIRSILLAGLVLALLVPSAARARFVVLYADFDNRSLGAGLDRRGALFGEPSADGQNDTANETVVFDALGDRSLAIYDNGSPTDPVGNELIWTFREGEAFSDGQMNISCSLQPESLDVYSFRVEGDAVNSRFFGLSLDAAGNIYWHDEDDLAVTQFSTYAANDVLNLELSFDLDSGTYDMTLNGIPYLTAEAHGVVAEALSKLVVGNGLDGNNTGSIRFDDLLVDWTPGTAMEQLIANFNNQPLNQVIGTGGATVGEPISYLNCTPTVKLGPTPTPSLEIEDDVIAKRASASNKVTDRGEVVFELLNNVALDNEAVSISFFVLTDVTDGYFVEIREPGGDGSNFATIVFDYSGLVEFYDANDPTTPYFSTIYTPTVEMKIELAYEMSLGKYFVWVNGSLVVVKRDHGAGPPGLGRLVFGVLADSDLDGRMRVDNIKVHTLDTITSVGEPSEHIVRAPVLLHGAVPNPFNPATAIQFSLKRAARVELDIFDSRGRRVRRLLAEQLPAGDHAPVWQGIDDTGRLVASGVYHARLTAGSTTQTTRLTLVK